jgi:enoyl-CoA hydratase/carnithine racemase
MFTLFNYSTLLTRLDKGTRTLHVSLKQAHITQEMLFEMESLLSWCTGRVEISSLLLDSHAGPFSRGLDTTQLPHQSAGHLEKTQQRLQKIVYALMQLPQTVVVDYGDGAANWAAELGLGADVRLCAEGADIRFDHARWGLVPACGGMGFLALLVSASYARAWTASGAPVPAAQLTASGLIHGTYTSETREGVVGAVLTDIHAQAPVQRVQTKLGVFEAHREALERAWVADRKIAKAALISEDWKNLSSNTKGTAPFMPAKSLSYSVKLSLVKSENPTEIQ